MAIGISKNNVSQKYYENFVGNLLLLAAVVSVCIGCRNGSFGSNGLGSVAYIEPNKYFDLGSGKHGSYTATITNKGQTNIEATIQTPEGSRKTVESLKPNQKATCTIAENTTANFENQGDRWATLAIEITGDISLGMGYKKNR